MPKIHSIALAERQNADAFHERQMAALKRDYGVYAEVGEMWNRQTNKAAIFKTHGAIAHVLLRWRKPDGSVVAWTCGRHGDVLIAPVWALNKKGV
jgi:hypothetical protein